MESAFLDMTIGRIVAEHPAALALFEANGLGVFADPEVRESFGTVVRLRSVLRERRIDPQAFCRNLAETAGMAEGGGARAVEETLPGAGTVNLFALLPCPLKVPVEEAFHRFLRGRPADARPITFCIEGNANNQVDYYDYVAHFETIGELPDIIVTPGFNGFFHRGFVERFIKPGDFEAVIDFAGDRHLAALGVLDPERHYTMLCMNLLVLVVDKGRLGGRPVPRRWRDLLAPELEKSVAIRGNRDGSFCETLLLAVHKAFGMEGVRQLGRSTRHGWHPSQMVKAAGSGRDDAPAVSVMPLFFANAIRNRDDVEIVWPGDGALVSPVTMLVKRDRREELADVVRFLTGPEVARICAGAFFPALHPEVDNGIPAEATFFWIGWEFVKEHDIEALLAEIDAEFRRAFRGEGA
ncbi:ABC transporter substrate-binding protein [Geobacter sp.]|uniref:ABC transporter substrate-binding protein n=1 Tax=Geobacter sp. TaxID=46610 RepID=UPI0026346C53|nr:ABC transporter substrate-binding protein [Geobacter sp.]